MPSVLVVDDEPQIATIAKDYLIRAGFSVAVAADGATGLEMARQKRPDLIVLDLGLPGLDGLELARAVRRESDVPIIMLTARVDEADRLRGFEVGADDYITKPFSPRELVARVSSVLRRARHDPDRTSRFDVADLTIDAAKMRVERNGTLLDLTATEFQLVSALARHPGRVYTRSQLLDAVRGTEIESFERAIDAHVKNVRRKIERDPHRPRYLLTVYGIGYKFAEA
jgi:two-component system alkaline phosphatase synthesis response regulator PhoP